MGRSGPAVMRRTGKREWPLHGVVGERSVASQGDRPGRAGAAEHTLHLARRGRRCAVLAVSRKRAAAAIDRDRAVGLHLHRRKRREHGLQRNRIGRDQTDRGGKATYHGPDHCELTVHRVALKRALTNLVDNALHHGTRVDLRLDATPAQASA